MRRLPAIGEVVEVRRIACSPTGEKVWDRKVVSLVIWISPLPRKCQSCGTTILMHGPDAPGLIYFTDGDVVVATGTFWRWPPAEAAASEASPCSWSSGWSPRSCRGGADERRRRATWREVFPLRGLRDLGDARRKADRGRALHLRSGQHRAYGVSARGGPARRRGLTRHRVSVAQGAMPRKGLFAAVPTAMPGDPVTPQRAHFELRRIQAFLAFNRRLYRRGAVPRTVAWEQASIRRAKHLRQLEPLAPPRAGNLYDLMIRVCVPR